MKVLILTGRFGMGHIKCAEAIKREIVEKHSDTEVEIVDIMDFLYPRLSDYVYYGFSKVASKYSEIFNALSKISEFTSTVPLKGIAIIKLAKYMSKYQPDLVICNVPVCVQYFDAYKKILLDRVPFYIYVTDIALHRDWVSKEADLYFVGDERTKLNLVKHGIDKDIISVSGIPVSKELEYDEKSEKVNDVLVMGGGLGIIPGGENTLRTLNGISDIKTTLVCGKNRKLQKVAKDIFRNINVIGLTNDIPKLMKESSILITKPGGSTTFEAIKSCTPLFIVEPELEQELGNADFIIDKGIGKVVYDIDNLESELEAFIKDKEELNKMKNNMKKLSNSFKSTDPIEYYMKKKTK